MVALFVPPWDQVGKFSELFISRNRQRISRVCETKNQSACRPQRDTARRLGHDRPRTGCTNDANGHIAAMAARYETLQEDEVIVPSSKGHTDASAAAMMKKWGKNEIPEEKEPLWRMFAMQFVGTVPAMVRMRPAPSTTHRVAMPHTARCPASTVVLCTTFRGSCNR